ncbi:MAG TPA: hypothetical protein VKF38_04465 [Anaerolineaceae bacterium]|nr:hypothetical protein [Anaerolineaceae bacterium]
MIFQQLNVIPVILLMGSSLSILISQRWRYTLISLAVQYLAVFWLVALVWPVGLAAIKLVVGLMAGALIGSLQPSDELVEEKEASISGRIFRSLAAGLIWLVVFSIAPGLMDWFPAQPVILWGGLILVGMGLLQLGMTTRPLRIIVGLLTVISGFEILYASVESSILVAGLLAMINLGIGLTGAYLLAGPAMKDLS